MSPPPHEQRHHQHGSGSYHYYKRYATPKSLFSKQDDSVVVVSRKDQLNCLSLAFNICQNEPDERFETCMKDVVETCHNNIQ
jgi:hypothetical protein